MFTCPPVFLDQISNSAPASEFLLEPQNSSISDKNIFQKIVRILYHSRTRFYSEQIFIYCFLTQSQNSSKKLQSDLYIILLFPFSSFSFRTLYLKSLQTIFLMIWTIFYMALSIFRYYHTYKTYNIPRPARLFFFVFLLVFVFFKQLLSLFNHTLPYSSPHHHYNLLIISSKKTQKFVTKKSKNRPNERESLISKPT